MLAVASRKVTADYPGEGAAALLREPNKIIKTIPIRSLRAAAKIKGEAFGCPSAAGGAADTVARRVIAPKIATVNPGNRHHQYAHSWPES
jgi:hypothetical protein